MVSDAKNCNKSTQTSQLCYKQVNALRRKIHSMRVANTRLKKTVCGLKAKCKKLQSQLADCRRQSNYKTDQLVPDNSWNFFSSQTRLFANKPKGRRFSNEMKLLALNLHNLGARAYRFLTQIMALPSKTSLSLWLHSLPCEPGFNNELFCALQHKVESFSVRDKVCALLIDEMSLKSGLLYDPATDMIIGYEDYGEGIGRYNKVATSALVFMLRGLASNWKQPLSYVLTSSTCNMCYLKKLLLLCLTKLSDIGLTVKVIISDQGSNFQQLVKDLGVSISEPYFIFNNEKYYYMFDPPHLLKSIRNNLYKHSFVFNQKKACWKVISDFYAVDCKQKFRLAPKLTKKHIDLPAFSKMKVKLAAQVLSSSVAAGLVTQASLLGADAQETADFVKGFDEIFDAVNSSQLTCEKPLRCAMSSNSVHLSYFHTALTWLNSLSVIDNNGCNRTKAVKCLKGWQISISAIIQLWDDLHRSYNFTFLYTRRLNQDPLENTFAVIRQKGGNCDHPMPNQFRHLFKQACCSKLLQPGNNSNCELDMSKLLGVLQLGKTVKKNMASRTGKITLKSATNSTFPTTSMFKSSDILEENSLYYVCGFLARKLVQWHPCSVCQSLFHSPSYGSKGMLTELKSFIKNDSSKSSPLFTVSDEFFCYIQQLETVFDAGFEKHKCMQNVAQVIVNEILKCAIPTTCTDFPLLKFAQLYVRMRIYYSLKFYNEQLRSSASKGNRAEKKLNKVKH
jgi:DNA transposase THAP9